MANTPPKALLVGALGVGMFQIAGLYEGTAMSVSELRAASPNDVHSREALMDADIIVGGLTAVAAVLSSWATESVWPIILFGSAFITVAGWHHIVLNTPSTKER